MTNRLNWDCKLDEEKTGNKPVRIGLADRFKVDGEEIVLKEIKKTIWKPKPMSEKQRNG